MRLQLGWFLKINSSVSIGLNSDPQPRGKSLWASRAFDRSPPNLRVRRLKFLFAAAKENLKAKIGFDGWRHGIAAICWRIVMRSEGQTELGVAPEVFRGGGFALGVGLSHGVELTCGVEFESLG
jgi:hypothetical protein